jgi:RNA polymerase sigma-70 factor (ECF subfamily)
MARATESLDRDEAREPAAVAPVVPAAISRIDLDRAIAQLPPGCRAAFVLHDVEGRDHREVARALGISEGTSKSQVHKARMRLRPF